jgi:2-polyprenyl-3-methyl-5-hydroxy-6-metoxy-1,4-benzoquinol methylase
LSRYATEIDLANPNNSQTQLIELVAGARSVLDVGCAAGDTARALVDRGCRVSGVDVDAEAAEPARSVLDELVIADIDQSPLSSHFKAESFDAIIFGDVLEHLVDPASVLRDSVSLLTPGGRILVSIPNIAHGSVRLALLTGEWEYTAAGLLDRTHLRFFTRATVCRLLEDAGLLIEELRSTVLDPLDTEVQVDADRLPAAVVEWVRHQPDALNYQYIAAARPLAPGEVPGLRPPLEPALPLTDVRTEDEHTERMRKEQEERHRLLTVRDHIIGLEASVASADARTSRARTRARYAERRAKALREELDLLTAELDRLSRGKGALGRLAQQVRAMRENGS